VQRLTQIFLSLFSLRTLVLLSVVWLLARGPMLQIALDARDKVQTYLFRLALHLSDLPLPRTQITVIHVPDIEYERWLVDLAGAGSLEQLLGNMDDDALVGLVLEQPLVMVQPVAESMLQEIQQGRRTRDPLYEDVNNVLARREGLTQLLTSKRLVLGLMDQSSHFYRRIPVQESFLQYPQLVRDWLWPWPEPVPTPVVSPLLQYFPIDSAPRQARRLASLEDDKVIPMFPLQFWAASENLHSPENMTKVLNWRRDRGFNLGAEQIRTSVTAEIVPVYGAYSGIRTSMRQITLGAALAGNTLSGWILLGRDGSATLEQSAQVIASLGDRAFLYEPAWWSLAQKALLTSLAIYLMALLPMLALRWVIGVTSVVLAGLASTQVVGQIFAGFWLPVGDLLLFSAGGCIAMLIWRWQRQQWHRLVERADQSALTLASRAVEEVRLQDALGDLRNCRTTPTTLELFYNIAERYEEQGEREESLAVLRELRRRRFRYRDVGARIKRLRASILYRQTKSAEEDADTLVSEPASSLDAHH
jgi:hypothetical protein